MAATVSVFFPTDPSILGERTTLTAAVAAGATALPVVNTDGMSQTNGMLLIGELGSEEAEIKQSNGVSGSTLNCMALTRAHAAGTPVSTISANLRKVYGCATATGTYAVIGTSAYLGVGIPTGTVYPYSPTTYRYLKATYWQSITSSESLLADAAVVDIYDHINYCSVGAYKTYAGITGAEQDDEIAAALRAATATINAYLFGDSTQTLFSTTYTERVTTLRLTPDVLVLKHWPISSVTSITVDGTTVYPGSVSIETTDGAVVYLDSDLARPYAGQRLNASVVYVAGYTVLPDDVTIACQKLTANLLNKDTRDASGIRAYSIGTKRVEYDTSVTNQTIKADAIPSVIQSLLAPYKRSLIHRYQ